MTKHKDQDGKLLDLDTLLMRVSEAILTHVMALEACGISRDRMEIVVGEDGGMVRAGELLFQTPIENKLTKAEGVRLFNVFKDLLKQYDDKALEESYLLEVKARNRYDHKCSVIRKRASKLN